MCLFETLAVSADAVFLQANTSSRLEMSRKVDVDNLQIAPGKALPLALTLSVVPEQQLMALKARFIAIVISAFDTYSSPRWPDNTTGSCASIVHLAQRYLAIRTDLNPPQV